MSGFAKPLLAAAVAVALTSTPARAQLWFNGEWNGTSSVLPSERDLWVPDTRIYDNFLVSGGGWNVTTLFGDFLSSLSPVQAYWEIRSGVSLGNGGTLLYSGTSNLSWVQLGPGLWGDGEYRATIGGLNLTLSAGMYWMTIAPTQSIYGRAYATTTNGTGGVGSLLDGNGYWDSQTFGKNFASTSAHFRRNVDFAYGVDGVALPEPGSEPEPEIDLLTDTTTAPEPGSLLLAATGLGLVGLAYRRRKNRV